MKKESYREFAALFLITFMFSCQNKHKVQQTPFPEWVNAARSNCEEYEVALNDIQKSEIFNRNKTNLTKAVVQNTIGELDNISTNQGGSEANITITVNYQNKTVTFLGDVTDNLDVYAAVANMSKGQCVQFSATGIRANSFFERSKVCDNNYEVDFTQITNCQ